MSLGLWPVPCVRGWDVFSWLVLRGEWTVAQLINIWQGWNLRVSQDREKLQLCYHVICGIPQCNNTYENYTFLIKPNLSMFWLMIGLCVLFNLIIPNLSKNQILQNIKHYYRLLQWTIQTIPNESLSKRNMVCHITKSNHSWAPGEYCHYMCLVATQFLVSRYTSNQIFFSDIQCRP